MSFVAVSYTHLDVYKRQVGLPNIRRVADLKAAGALASNEAVDLLAGADGFAEVYPEDKYLSLIHI